MGKKSRNPYSKAISHRGKVYGAAGYQLYKDVNYLMTLVNSELHIFGRGQSFNSSSTGVVYSLTSIPQGDTSADRTGTSVLPRYVGLNMTVYKNLDSSSTNHTNMRIILFQYWGEASDSGSGASVSVSDVLSPASPIGFLNPDNTGSRGDKERRIRILRDQRFVLDKLSYTSRVIKMNVQLNGQKQKQKQHIKFDSSTTAEPLSGGIYLLVIDDNATGVHHNACDFLCHTKFYDN